MLGHSCWRLLVFGQREVRRSRGEVSEDLGTVGGERVLGADREMGGNSSGDTRIPISQRVRD